MCDWLTLQGNATNYEFLVRQLAATDATPKAAAARHRIFQALPRCVSAMAREPAAFQSLFDALFKFSFLADADEVASFTRFVVHLVSSNTVFVLPTLQLLARSLCRPQQLPPWLVPPPSVPATAPTKRIAVGVSFGGIVATPAATSPDNVISESVDVEARIEQRYTAAHETLRRVLALVPTAANVLFPVLCEHLPHKRLATVFQVAYLRNVLTLSTYAPGLQERVLGLVVDQLVAVDVEIKLDEKEEDVFTMDDFLDDELLPAANASGVDEMADKLDEMMLTVFAHVEALVGAPSSSAEEDANTDNDTSSSPSRNKTSPLDVHKAATVFRYLLKVFERSILNTHRSKYPQFLLFYVCRLDPQFQDVFLSQLLATSLDSRVPPVTRHSCGAYLASFLARAKYLSVAYIEKALYHLLQWMHAQMDAYDAALLAQQQQSDVSAVATNDSDRTVALDDPREATTTRSSFHESIYVSSLQTVCYMLCFRGLEVAQTPNGYDFLRSLGWERVLFVQATGYCPLAFCQQTVASEFLNVVETFELVSDECVERVDQAISALTTGAFKSSSSVRVKTMERSAAPTVDAASTTAISSSSRSSGAVVLLGQRQPLETFFPFDPYLLRRSFKYIGPSYLYWKHADPMASDNCDALSAVKAAIKAFDAEHGGGDNSDDDDDNDDNDDNEDNEDNEDDTLDDDDASMAGSVDGASFKGLSYFEASMARAAHGASSLGSSVDDDAGDRMRRTTAPKLKKTASRSAFEPSPALSASSPPSRLPPLGSANAFTLGGFDDDEDDGF